MQTYAPPQEKGVCLRMHNNGPDLYMQRRKKRIKIKCLTRIRHQQHPNRALPKNVSNASRHNLVHTANKSVDQLPLVFFVKHLCCHAPETTSTVSGTVPKMTQKNRFKYQAKMSQAVAFFLPFAFSGSILRRTVHGCWFSL